MPQQRSQVDIAALADAKQPGLTAGGILFRHQAQPGDANRRLRHAIEIRHESFVSDDFISLLKKHGIGLVVADTAGKRPKMFEVTADFVYVRLHGDKVIYTSGYTRRALDEWAERIREWHRRADVYVYFNNDVKVRAPYDAQTLMRKLGLCWPADADKPRLPRWNFRRPARGASRAPSRTRTAGIPARR